ncbi:MAG: hypothetical protein HMLIMOIP_000787 [Candidatus Nitrosomirales archaeon]|jgi:hypothetical protein
MGFEELSSILAEGALQHLLWISASQHRLT